TALVTTNISVLIVQLVGYCGIFKESWVCVYIFILLLIVAIVLQIAFCFSAFIFMAISVVAEIIVMPAGFYFAGILMSKQYLHSTPSAAYFVASSVGSPEVTIIPGDLPPSYESA